MGANCCVDRRQAQEKASDIYKSAYSYTAEKVDQASKAIAPKISQLSEDYAPHLESAQERFYLAKLSAQGYVNEQIDLSSAKHGLEFLIDFESQLPLRFISLNDFEEHLYRAESLEVPDFATVESIVECFKDFPGFEDIDEPFTLTRELMFDTIFLVKDESEQPATYQDDGLSKRKVYLPSLVLLGILYCRSSRLQRADKLFELFDPDDDEFIKQTDKVVRAFIPQIVEITYKLMFRLYKRHRDLTPDENGKVPIQIEVDIQQYLPQNEVEDYDMKVHYFNDFGINVMKDSSKLDKITFLERLEKKCYQILWPSEIRNKLYSNLLENRAA